MVDLEEFKVTFFQETQELLDDMENDMLLLQDGEATDETINAIFRAVHSAKGGAGAFGLDRLVDFAHVFETLLDRMRNGEHEADEKTVNEQLERFAESQKQFETAAKSYKAKMAKLHEDEDALMEEEDRG